MPLARSDNTPSCPLHRDHGLVRGFGTLGGNGAQHDRDDRCVGPFVTIPLIVATMHGPQAMVGWILGALLVVCDGLVWVDLAPRFPMPAARSATFARCTDHASVDGSRSSLSFSSPSARRSRWPPGVSALRRTRYLWPADEHNTIMNITCIAVDSRHRHDVPGIHNHQRHVPRHGHCRDRGRPPYRRITIIAKRLVRSSGSAWLEPRWRLFLPG